MLDRPDAATLLRAMAATLTDEVMPTTSGPARHSVRVVANLCRILEREVGVGASGAEQTREDLVALLGMDATLPELVAELDRALCADSSSANGKDAQPFEARVREVILADVVRRLEIDRPGYAS